MSYRRPYVLVYVTSSVDGKIASRTGDSRLSCPYDLRRLHRLRASLDAVMVGAGTVIADDPRLTVRYVRGRNPARVVVDGRLRSPLTARLFNDGEARTIVLTSGAGDEGKAEELRRRGVEVVVAGKGPRLSGSEILSALARLGIRSVLVEGGGDLIWSLVREGLVDEFRVTISPFIIGGAGAKTAVEGEGFGEREEWLGLTLANYFLCECGEEIHLIYRRREPTRY